MRQSHRQSRSHIPLTIQHTNPPTFQPSNHPSASSQATTTVIIITYDEKLGLGCLFYYRFSRVGPTLQRVLQSAVELWFLCWIWKWD